MVTRPGPLTHLNVLTFFSLTEGCSEGLVLRRSSAFRFFFKEHTYSANKQPSDPCFFLYTRYTSGVFFFVFK